MKKLLIAGLLIAAAPAWVLAQSAGKVPSGNCYNDWEIMFRQRGGKPVTDGTHEVIIALEKDGASHCFMGKTTVQGGRIVGPTFVQKEDGTYEPVGKKLDPSLFIDGRDVSLIDNASSQVLRTTDGETGKFYFYKFLNEKVKANKVAPSPAELIKN
jgi:hypothetical protein